MCPLGDSDRREMFESHVNALRSRARDAFTSAVDEALEKIEGEVVLEDDGGEADGPVAALFGRVMERIHGDKRVQAFSSNTECVS